MAPAAGSLGGGKGQAQTRGQARNPSLPLTPDGHQVAASNSTLNAWVGRRQPSWLANATPVQPTPRPAPPPSLVTPAPSARIAASSQPQPQPQPQSQSRLHSQPHSQSQSLQQPQYQSQHTLQPRPRSSAPPLPLQTGATAGPLHLSSLADPVLPSPAPSDEPSPCLSFPRDSPRDSPNTRSPCPATADGDPPTTEAHFVLDSHVNHHPLSSPQSRDFASPANNGQRASIQDTMQAQQNPAAPSTIDVAALNTPPAPTVVGPSNAAATPQDAPRPIAPKRRRVENNALIFFDELNAHARLTSYLRGLVLDRAVEHPRFLLLTKACREGDIFFVVLHQLFCTWSTSPASVHGLCHDNSHDTSLVDDAFETMGAVLKANSALRSTLLQWLANFPLPLALLRPREIYARTINQVLDFLVCLSKKWTIVNREHSLQGYPFLMSELVNTFRLYSPILQQIVFRASRRTLGAPDHPIGMEFDRLFEIDQEKHRDPKDGTYSLRMKGETYDKYNSRLIQQYQSLFIRFRVAPHTRSGYSPSTLPTSSTAHSPDTLSASMISNHPRLQSETAPGSRRAPPPINTGRAVPSAQNIHSPSPTYPPLVPMHPMATSNISPDLTSQFTTAGPHIIPHDPPNGIGTPIYQSPNIAQQGHPGHFDAHPQLNPQQLHYQQLQQEQIRHHYRIHQQPQYQYQQQYQQPYQHQQQQTPAWQQQNFQQQHPLQYTYRKRSQPGAAPNPRPSPTQTAFSSAGQMPPVEQPPPRLQDIANHSVLSGALDNPAAFSGPPNLTHQSSMASASRSPQPANAVQPSHLHPRPLLRSQQQPTRTIDRLIPPPGARINLQDYPPTPYDKRSVDLSLHQAHLRSPKRIPMIISADTLTERYYQAVKEFALEPTPILRHTHLYELTFNVPGTVVEKLTLDEKVAGEILPVNRFTDGSLRVRVKCCSLPMGSSPTPDHAWVTSETKWPDHIFMSLNGQVIEIKRKQHHSKDLPVDISSVVCAGSNTLSISVFPGSMQHKQHAPYVAVEIIEVLSHSAISRMVRTSGRCAVAETREVIRRRLAGNKMDDDLEIPDGISIDLADPFTSTIFKVPVRGKACKHLECFDFENWLNSRLGKKSTCVCGGPVCKCPKEPSFVDQWKCPMCSGDARPYSLRIDEFLMEVRNSLEKNNQLRTKSITVSVDGSWKANDSHEDGNSDIDSDDQDTPAAPKAASRPPVPRTVIELDDD